MNKRFLDKKNCLLLKQPLPENISQKARLRGKEKRAKFKADSSQNKPDYSWQYTVYAQKLSKLDRMRQAEIQIVRELLQKKGFEDATFGVSGKYIENNTKMCFLQNNQILKNTTHIRAGNIEASLLAREKKTNQQKKSLATPIQQLALLPPMPIPQNIEKKKQQHKRKEVDTITSDSALNYASSEPSRYRIQTYIEKDCLTNLPAPKVYQQREKLSISSLFSIKSQKEEFLAKLPQQIPKELVEGCVLLLLSIEQIRNILVEKRIEKRIPSELRNQLLESKKIRFLYGGLSKRELKKSIKKARQLLGSATDNLLIVLESRLDVALKRCGFFPSIRSARQSVIHKRIQINNKIVSTPGYQLQPGDLIKVQPNSVLCKNNSTNIVTDKSTVNEQSPKSWGSPISLSITRDINKKKYSTLNSLLQLEFLLSSFCVQKDKNEKETIYLDIFSENSKKREIADILPFDFFSFGQKQEQEFRAVLQTKALRYDALLFTFKQPQYGVRLLLRDLYTTDKAFLRFDRLVEKSQLYLAFQNKGESKTQHFTYLFTKQFSSNFKSSFQKKNCIDKDFALKFSSNLFKVVGPNLSLHLQQIFSEEQQAILTKAHLFTKVPKEQKAIFPFDHTFYNVYSYWLQTTKKLFLQDAKKQLSKRQNVLCHFSDTMRFQHRRTKPLHLEVSYQSLSAIFLYPPQQIYLPALVNVDLLLKSL